MPKPNLIVLITDQQRAPQHWAHDQAWIDELMPNDAELRRTGVSFTRAFVATAPSAGLRRAQRRRGSTTSPSSRCASLPSSGGSRRTSPRPPGLETLTEIWDAVIHH